MSRMKTKSISLDTWEEIPVALIFRKARESVETQMESPSAKYFVPGLSAALSTGVYMALAKNSLVQVLAVTECHHSLCKTEEIRHGMQSFGNRKFITEFRDYKKMQAFYAYGAELLVIYLQFMELWAIDVGLTYRYQAGTLAGQLILNTPNGPQDWE